MDRNEKVSIIAGTLEIDLADASQYLDSCGGNLEVRIICLACSQQAALGQILDSVGHCSVYFASLLMI
jgi:hypothetical protein